MRFLWSTGTQVVTIAGQQLVTGIMTAPLGVVTTGSALGDILLKAGSFLITLSTSNNVPRDTLQFATEESIGFVLSKAASEYLASGGVSAIADPVVRKLVQDDGVIWTNASGDNAGSGFIAQGAPFTKADIDFAYNPFSRYITGAIHAQCQMPTAMLSEVFIIRYPVDDVANVTGPVTVCSTSLHSCRTAAQ